MWDGQIEALRDRFQVIVWDMRGHGQSDVSDRSIRLFRSSHGRGHGGHSAQPAAFERAVIGGLSLGGYMSLAFHRVHPAMMRALMIFDTGPGFRNAEARETWNQRARQRADDLDARGLAALGTQRRGAHEPAPRRARAWPARRAAC